MSLVYDFHEEDEIENDDEIIEAGVTAERFDSCYNYTKDLPSFSTWSLTLSGQGKIYINLDGIDIDTYVKVKYPDINYKFGAVDECGLSSDKTCLKFFGGAGCTVELLWTDHVMGTKLLYKQLDCSSVTNFCKSLSTFLKKGCHLQKFDQTGDLALGLCANENASISKPTTQFEQAALIRQELLSSLFQGQASRHIYQIFNAVCPNNKDEELRRQKRLRSLIRIAPFDQECWDLISKIHKEKPNQSLYIYNELTNVSAMNAKIILEEVIRKKHKLSEISRKCKQIPKESSEDSASQRIQRPKGLMTATTETEKDKKDMNEELKWIQEQVQTLGKENTRLKYQLEENVRVLQATMKENSRLKETVKECREDLEQQNAELEVLEIKLDNYDFALQEHRKENEKLNEALKLARQSPRIHENFLEEEIKTLPFSVDENCSEKEE